MTALVAGIDTNSTPVTSETLIAGLAKQIPDVGGADHLWKISFEGRVNSTVAGDLVRVRIKLSQDGTGTTLERGQVTVPLSGGSGQQTLHFFALLTTASTPWVSATIQRLGGSGSVLVAAETDSPAYLLLEDLGAI